MKRGLDAWGSVFLLLLFFPKKLALQVELVNVAQKLATFSCVTLRNTIFPPGRCSSHVKQSKDYRVPIHVGLEPKSNNLVEVGVGFSTDEGCACSTQLGKTLA